MDHIEELRVAYDNFEAKKKQLESEFQETKATLLSKAQSQVIAQLSEAANLYQALPEELKLAVRAHDDFPLVLTALGLHDGKPRAAKRRAKVTDDVILAYLDTERRTNEIAHHCKLSKLTTGKRLESLLAAKRVTMRKEGTSKFWIKG
jgi:hypothetical protein